MIATRVLSSHYYPSTFRPVEKMRGSSRFLFVVVAYAVRRMMCSPESESTTSDIWPTSSAYVPSCARRERRRGEGGTGIVRPVSARVPEKYRAKRSSERCRLKEDRLKSAQRSKSARDRGGCHAAEASCLTSNAFCILPGPKNPRSPPCFAEEQSETFAARSAKVTTPDAICSRYARSSSRAASLVFLGMYCPSGSRQDAGRRLLWCLTSRCDARTSSDIVSGVDVYRGSVSDVGDEMRWQTKNIFTTK